MICTRTQLVVVALAAALAGPALATNTGTCKGDPHKCNPTTPSTPSATSGSTSAAGSASTSSATSAAAAISASQAGALATGVGNGYGGNATSAGGAGGSAKSNAAGGAGGTATAGGGESNASNALNEGDSSTRMWVLPGPTFTPPMAPVSCPSAMITQDSIGIGWNFISRPTAKTDTSDCTLIQMRNAKVDTCQYASAKQIEDLLVQKHLEKFKPSDVGGFVDLNPRECAALKMPVQQEVARLPALKDGEAIHPVHVTVTLPQSTAPECALAAKKAARRVAAPSKQCSKT